MSTPQWALDRIQEAKEKGLTRLNLNRDLGWGNQHFPLKEIPDAVFNLGRLTYLDLSDNELVSLSEKINQLQNLIVLNLGNNQLANLPKTISQLHNLAHLDLSNNRLANLSETISQLHNLTHLDLSRNQLANLPETISQLHNLKELYLNNNPLAKLPETISQLHNLTYLYLSRTLLVSLPETISELKNLKELGLSNTQLISLPETISQLHNVTHLDLSNNQLASPPQEVARKGIAAIREYFRQLREQGQGQIYEAKLLILGEGGAGKTTLAKKVADATYTLQDEISTEGVDVTTWHFPLADGKTFRVNLWDFGGQEIYHATHQFFLTKRSLYALVADNRKEDTDFFYWLNVVELLSENSPLLIIKNEKQDRQREINERQLRGQFDNLKEVVAVNFADNRGLDRLKDAIQHHIRNLSHIGSLLPKTWVRVRERLEQDARNHITLQEYFVICRANGFADEKDSLQLSGYLNDIGVFLHFQDEPLLKKTVILKPKWGTDAVYKVLDNAAVIQNKGRFNRTDLTNIWDEPEYSSMRDELLQLMMKFKLCYEIPGEKGIYIAPQLLSENQPEYPWNENENLLLRYDYEFMPKGILLQLIVALNKIIWQQNVWRSGVLFEKDKTRAEVIELYGKRQIRVRVAGAHKKELMTIVLYELDKIHATYKRLKYDKLIPCNCMECKTKPEPHFYRFETLSKFIEDRQDKIQCQQSYTMVDVRGLIDDVFERKTRSEELKELAAQYNIYINQGEKKMTENKISINNSTIHGSVVAAENIKNSFNVIEKAPIQDNLKQQLKQLTQAVEAMTQALPKEQAEEVADDMKRLADEATKPTPNKKWYSVSIDGLTKAAKNLGEVGEPVVKLAAKVLTTLIAG